MLLSVAPLELSGHTTDGCMGGKFWAVFDLRRLAVE